MRLLLLLKAAAALSSGALPPSAVYKPTQTGDRALSWAASVAHSGGVAPTSLWPSDVVFAAARADFCSYSCSSHT